MLAGAFLALALGQDTPRPPRRETPPPAPAESAKAPPAELLSPFRAPVHPLFVPDPNVMRAAYVRGWKTAKANLKMTQAQLMRKWSLDIAKIGRGKKGWTAPYVTVYCPAAMAEQWGFDDHRAWKEPTEFETYLANFPKDDDPQRALKMEWAMKRVSLFVRLYAWPGVGTFGDISRAAKESDVQKVKFGVLVDGKTWLPHNRAPGRIRSDSGEVTTTTTGTRSVDVSTAYGSGTVTYNVYNTWGYPYYTADYSLQFMGHEDGIATVPPTARKLTLKVQRRDFEQSVDIDLNRLMTLVPKVARR